MPRRQGRVFFVLCAALLAWAGLPASAWSQTVDVEAVVPEPSDKAYVFNSGYDHLFQSDVGNNGHFARDTFSAGLGGRFELSESLSLNTRFIYELNAYKFSNDARPFFEWQNINQYTLAPILDWKLDEQWALLGGPFFRYAAEGSASFDHAFSGGGLIGFNHTASKDLSLGLAIGVLSQIEDKAGIVPIPMVRWHFAEAWTLRTGISHLGGRAGLGPELTWQLEKDWDLGFGMQYQRRRFRLNEHGANDKAVGEESSLPVYARLTWRPLEAASIEFLGGLVAGGNLKIQDENGGNTYDKGYDATPMLGLRGEYRF